MIEFNERDINLVAIRRESKLFNLVSRYKYHIYGLRQQDNPPILIEYNHSGVNEKFDEKLSSVVTFLRGNGIEVDTYSESETSRVDIGLRKDLRLFENKNGKPLFASSILSTIIYTLEGRTDIGQLSKFKLTVVPFITKLAIS